jgi:hypothetical protein
MCRMQRAQHLLLQRSCRTDRVMNNDSSWPNAIINLERFLDRVGLKCERREEEASFGNKLLQYEGELAKVRAVSDRGVWFVEVADAQAQSNQWYDVAILRDLLIGQGEDVLPLQEQVDLLERNWPAICSRFSPSEREYTSTRLAILRQERARRRLPGFFRSPPVVH